MTDQEYVRKTLNGDREAYGRLIDAYQNMVFAVALNITGSYSDSQDIVQESFLHAYRKLRTLSNPAKFPKWLCTIAKRIAIRFLKKRRRFPVSDSAIAVDQMESGYETVAESFARKELSALLWDQVDTLPPKTKEAVLLHYMEGFSIKRAAAFLGISESAMKTRLNFGRERLREIITDEIEDELRQNQPARKNRNYILAALPAGGVPKVGLLGSLAIKGALTMATISAKKAALIAAAIIIGIVSTVTIIHKAPKPSSVAPPVVENERESDKIKNKDRVLAETSSDTTSLEKIMQADRNDTHSISGTVINRLTDGPVAKIAVCIEKNGKLLGTSFSDTEGVFKFTGIDDSSYRIALDRHKSVNAAQYVLASAKNVIGVDLYGRDIDDIVFYLEPATYISGVVVDSNNNPIENAELELSELLDRENFGNTTSDTQGQFIFSGLSPLPNYTIEANAPGYAFVAITSLRTSIQSPLDDVVIRLQRGEYASISGRVINPQGQPVPGIMVTIRMSSLKLPFTNKITDENGKFIFDNLMLKSPLGVQLLLKEHKKELRLHLLPNEKRKDIEFVIDREIFSGYISGTVFDRNNSPVTHGAIIARKPGVSEREPDLSTGMVDESGSFYLVNLPENREVDLIYKQFKPVSRNNNRAWPKTVFETDAQDIPVSTDDLTVNVDALELSPPLIIIRGTILDDETKEPVKQFGVGISRFDSRYTIPKIEPRSNAQGSFVIESIEYHPEFTFVYAEADGYASAFTPVEISPSDTESLIAILLSPDTTEKPLKSISGTVINPEGGPVAGAQIRVWGKDSHVTSDAEGHFALTEIPESRSNNYYLTINHSDYKRYEASVPQLKTQSEVTDYKAQMDRGGTVEGYVWDKSGAGMPGIRVIAEDKGDYDLRSVAYTDTNGYYRAEHVPNSRVRIRLEDKTITGKIELIDMAEGRVAQVDFNEAILNLSGTVYRDEKPVPGLKIMLSDSPRKKFSWFSDAYTNYHGKFELRNVSPGKRYLNVFDGTTCLAADEIDVPESGNIVHDIHLDFGAVSGVVLAPDNTPVEGAGILAVVPGESTMWKHWRKNIFTDNNGLFSIDRAPAGKLILSAEAEGFGKIEKEIIVAPNQKTELVVLQFSQVGSLKITCINQNTGEYITPDFWTKLYIVDGIGKKVEKTIVFRNSTNAILSDINVGVYKVTTRFQAKDGKNYRTIVPATITVSAGEETLVELQMKKK